MSHYYLRSKSKTNMKKWYFEYFIADYFLSLFYDHSVAADFDGENDHILVEEIEDEDDFLVVGCGSDDDIDGILKKPDEVATSCSSLVRAFVSRLDFSASNGGHQTWN